MVYWSCVRSVMLYGSDISFLRENEMAILRRTERAMVRAMCGAKLMEQRGQSRDLMEMLALKENSGSDGKGKWKKMILVCVREG